MTDLDLQQLKGRGYNIRFTDSGHIRVFPDGHRPRADDVDKAIINEIQSALEGALEGGYVGGLNVADDDWRGRQPEE